MNQPHTAFLQTLCKKGLLPEQFLDSTAAQNSVTITESMPIEQTLTPIYVRIDTLEELKELGGVSNETYDGREDPNPMPSLPASELANKRALHRDYCLAMKKYVYGISEDVKEYADCINNKRMPINIPLFTGKKLVIPAGQTFTFPASLGPHIALSYELIEMGDRSRLVFECNVTLKVNMFKTGTDVIFINDGGDGGTGGTGGTGSGGGGGGSIGGTGAAGGNGNYFDYDIGDLDTTGKAVKITSRGGKGGDGGKGGNGGKGDYDENGGAGGNGGDGGKGGNGGDGKVRVGLAKPSSFTTDASGGAGGMGGVGGSGGDAGGGTSGNKGASGSAGNPSIGGNGGKIAIIS